MRYSAEHKQQTRERILEAAGKLFRERGFEGAGVDAVAAEAGVTSGAFYGHFKSKQDCLAATIEDSVAHSERMLNDGLEHLEGLHYAAASLRRYMSDQHWAAVTRGCPIPTLISELPRCDDSAKAALAKLAGAALDRMAGHARGDGAENKNEDAEVRRRLWAALSMAVGALALSRAFGDDDIAHELLEAARTTGVDAVLGLQESSDEGSTR